METLTQSKTQHSSSQTLSQNLIAGVLTGQAAGLIMAVAVMAVFTLFYGTSPLYPVQVIGSLVFGAAALHGFHLGALLAGLILHQLGPSLFWGVVFGLIVSNIRIESVSSALAIGIGIGVVSMVDVYFLVPAAMHALQGVDYWNQQVPMGWDWVAHIVFGASFALYPILARKLSRN